MKKVRISVIRKTRYDDLIARYENPIENACDMVEGAVFIANRLATPRKFLFKCVGNIIAICYGFISRRRKFLWWLDEKSKVRAPFLQ